MWPDLVYFFTRSSWSGLDIPLCFKEEAVPPNLSNFGKKICIYGHTGRVCVTVLLRTPTILFAFSCTMVNQASRGRFFHVHIIVFNLFSVIFREFCSKSQTMKWSDQHDLQLVKEILAKRPFDHPKGSRQKGQVWQTIVDEQA